MDRIDTLISKIAIPGTENYHCYDLLKQLLEDDNIYNIINDGIEKECITGFSKELWNNLSEQNLRNTTGKNLVDYFAEGLNIGRCKVFATQVSYSLNICDICGGIVPFLKGTTNSEDGSHTWIDDGNKIIDTSLMLEINNSYKNKIGYQEENRYNPNFDTYYSAAKEFANDTNLKRN